MAVVKNITTWVETSRVGDISTSDGGSITLQDGVTPLTTQSLIDIIVNDAVIIPRQTTVWTKDTKNATSWQPVMGNGSVVTVGTQNITDNSGNLLTDNSGNFIVTTSTYPQGKNVTVWSQV